MFTRNRLLILLLGITFSISICAQPDWKEQKNQDGIITYTRDKAGSSVKEVKAITTYNATPEQILKQLLDFTKYSEWMYGNKSTKVVKTENANSFVIYSEIEVPWPLQNRDVCHSVKVSRKGSSILIEEKCMPTFVPQNPDFVRVTVLTSTWELIPVNNACKTIMTIHSEPGGSVPDWVIDLFISEGPIKTFQNLKTRLN